jgi:hypothetical protein
MSELLKINVNDHTERKGQLTYLSWAWAWAEVLKIDPAATWEAHEKEGLPVIFLPDESAMVKVSVTIKADRKTCLLPVMDHKNKAIKKPDSFAINTAIMRCLAKAIAMHGLGLYIYAGEDLPEGEESEDKKPDTKPTPKPDLSGGGSREIAWNERNSEDQHRLLGIAKDIEALMPDAAKALDLIEWEALDNDLKAALAYKLSSATNAALKKLSMSRNGAK